MYENILNLHLKLPNWNYQAGHIYLCVDFCFNLLFVCRLRRCLFYLISIHDFPLYCVFVRHFPLAQRPLVNLCDAATQSQTVKDIGYTNKIRKTRKRKLKNTPQIGKCKYWDIHIFIFTHLYNIKIVKTLHTHKRQ